MAAQSNNLQIASSHTGHRPLTGVLFKLISSISFALMIASAKWGTESLESTFVVFARAGIILALLWPIMLWRGIPLLGRNRVPLHLRCLFGMIALHLFYFSLKESPLADAVVLSSTGPLYVPLLARILLGERLRPAIIALQLVGFAGMVAVSGPAFATLHWGLIAALASGFFIALGVVFLKKVTTMEHPLTIVSTFTVWTFVASLPWLPQAEWGAAAAAWLPLVCVALFALGGQFFLTRALAFAPAGIVAAIGYVGVVLSFLFGIVIWDEIPTTRSVVGAILIVGACIATAHLAARSRKPRE